MAGLSYTISSSFLPLFLLILSLPGVIIAHFLFPFMTQFKCPFLQEAFLGSPLCSGSALNRLWDSLCCVMLFLLAPMPAFSLDVMLPEGRNLALPPMSEASACSVATMGDY